MPWWVYIIVTQRHQLYTGITTDPARRFKEHQERKRGAKFFRHTTPNALVFLENCADRSGASRREYAIKQLTRSQKEALISTAFLSTQAHYEALALAAVQVPLSPPARWCKSMRLSASTAIA